jgi:hypothetical protein
VSIKLTPFFYLLCKKYLLWSGLKKVYLALIIMVI